MGVLLILITIGGLSVAALLLVISIVTKKAWLGTFVFGGVAVWFAFYLALLFGFSINSAERDLSVNEPKKFCGFYLDCHMNVAVNEVRRDKKIGNKVAVGEFYVVKVEIFSDAAKATLGLNTVDAHVIDAAGQTYNRDMKAEAELGPQPEFEKTLAPGENFLKEVVFDLPSDVDEPRLDLRQGAPIERIVEAFLINDEDSVLHRRIYFKLEDKAQRSAVK